ncbi:hypothetical protein AUP68_14079 [Ilyonectria robusta]
MPSPNINTANISRRRSPISPTNPSSQTQSRPLSSNSDQSSGSSTAGLEICQYGTEGVGGVPAGWLDQHFSSLPGLHDSIGKDIPGVQWRKSDIYLRNDYRTSQYRPSQQFQHVDTLISDPAKTIRERQYTNQQSRDERIMQAMAKMIVLPTALRLARQLAGTDRRLASALVLAHEKELAWAEERRQLQGARASSSRPTTRPAVPAPAQVSLLPDVPTPGEELSVPHELSDASSGSNATETIPNPPIPGEPAPSINALFARSKRKWVYTTRDSSTGEESSSDEPDATLNQRDRQAVQASGRQEEPITHDNLSRPITHDYHGVLMLWRLVVFAETEGDHEKAWESLSTQFGDQRAILTHLEHRKALKGIPSPANPWPDAIRSCDDDCTVPIELGIPCYHTIYGKLITATPLTKWDIHPRWHLREPVSEDVHRRILDPKIATNLRGRPKNDPQPIPASMAVSAPNSPDEKLDY